MSYIERIKMMFLNKYLVLGAVVATAGFFVSGAVIANHHKGAGKLFEKHDTNGDGVISKAEFLTHAEERFTKMDADGNGEVTKDEAKAYKEKMRTKLKEMKEKKEMYKSADE